MRKVLQKARHITILLCLTFLVSLSAKCVVSPQLVIKLRPGDCQKCYNNLSILKGLGFSRVTFLISEGNKKFFDASLDNYDIIPDSIIASNELYQKLSQRIDSELIICGETFTDIYYRCAIADISQSTDEIKSFDLTQFKKSIIEVVIDSNESFIVEPGPTNDQFYVSSKTNFGEISLYKILRDEATQLWMTNLRYDDQLLEDSIYNLESHFGHLFDYRKNYLTYQALYSENPEYKGAVPDMINYEGIRFMGNMLMLNYSVYKITSTVNNKTNKVSYNVALDHNLFFLYQDSSLHTYPYYLSSNKSKNQTMRDDLVFFYDNSILVGLEKSNVLLPFGNKLYAKFDAENHVLINPSKRMIKRPNEYNKINRKVGYDVTLTGLSDSSFGFLYFSSHGFLINENKRSKVFDIEIESNNFDNDFAQKLKSYEADQLSLITDITKVNGGYAVTKTLRNEIYVAFVDESAGQVTNKVYVGNSLSVHLSRPVSYGNGLRYFYVDSSTNEVGYWDLEIVTRN